MDILEQVEIKVDKSSTKNNLNKKNGDNWPLKNIYARTCLPQLERIKRQSISRSERVSIDQL